MMAYEPLTLLMAVGFYLATGSFHVGDIIRMPHSAVLVMPGFLLGFLFITAIKLRKSPFDLSTSHHAHQEMVKGITTEMAGPTLAVMNIAEYYEMVLMLGIVALFFLNEHWWSWPIAIVACLVVYLLEILWDNVCARVKWRTLLDSCWVVTLITGGLNGLILMLVHLNRGQKTMKKLAKSPWMLHYDASSCNGCDIEVLACTTPKYDIERFGIINTGDPLPGRYPAHHRRCEQPVRTGGAATVRTDAQPQGCGGSGHLRLHRRGLQGLLQHQRRHRHGDSRGCVCCPAAPPGPRPS